jgi:hypothetical protein
LLLLNQLIQIWERLMGQPGLLLSPIPLFWLYVVAEIVHVAWQRLERVQSIWAHHILLKLQVARKPTAAAFHDSLKIE